MGVIEAMSPSAKLEAILLYKGEPVTKKELSGLLSLSEKEILEAGSDLSSKLEDRGISLVETDDAFALVTAREASHLIERLEREEYSSELSKAALETLALIAYEGPLPKSKIDYVRGVNANFILRSLTTRGLVERIPDPENGRQTLYRTTIELMGHLGITRAEELPEYIEMRKSLAERTAAAMAGDKKEPRVHELEPEPDEGDTDA